MQGKGRLWCGKAHTMKQERGRENMQEADIFLGDSTLWGSDLLPGRRSQSNWRPDQDNEPEATDGGQVWLLFLSSKHKPCFLDQITQLLDA